MDIEIQKLIDLTTIIKVYENLNRKLIFGEEHYFSSFERGKCQQINLSNFENNWQNKWQSFGKKWSEERQNYRFFYDSFRLFYFSFEQLNFNKIACINESFGNQKRMLHFNELSGVNLHGIYHHGKKCIDLLRKLNLFDEQHVNLSFIKKFIETRNKLIEHNYNPYGLKLQTDPSIWSLAGTNSLLEIHIHKNNSERAYDAYVDYYEDYYQLEKFITDIIKEF